MATQTKGRPTADEGDPKRSHNDAPLRLDDFLPYQLNVAASLVSQALSRLYAERYGIGVPEWRVLVTLGEFESMTGKAVGAAVDAASGGDDHSGVNIRFREPTAADREKRRLAEQQAEEEYRRAAGQLPPRDGAP